MLRSNAHTHTCFCDGRDSAEAMVQAALAKGYIALGFSDHSYHPDCLDYCLSQENTERYIQEIHRLQQKYKDQIRIYLGLEEDYFAQTDLTPYEYRIGSVHHLMDPARGHLFSLDAQPDFGNYFETMFHGDAVALARSYYDTVVDFFTTRRPDIIGHFNIITKYNRDNRYFDENLPAYRSIACDALLAAAETGAVTEINTGGMARGVKDDFYPNEYMVRALLDHHYPLMINSDSHETDTLDAYFDEAVDWLIHLGARSVLILGADGWEEVGLKR